MRPILVLLAAAYLCLAQTPAERAAIEGRVVSAATGAPLKKSSVWIKAFGSDPGVNHAPIVASAATDAEGRFLLTGIEPGSYLLMGQRPGYLDQGYGAAAPQLAGPPLSLSPGQTMRGITLQLTPQSLLYGKVVDEDGDALPNAHVSILRVSYAGGRRHLVEAGAAASQDDGSFVVGNLTPGRYYLSAGLREVDQPRAPGARPERERPITTYYPSAADAAAATPVEVKPGEEARGLAIRLRKARVFRIRGKLTDAASGAPAPAEWVHLTPSGVAPSPSNIGVQSAMDGHFEFDTVTPGTYLIEAGSVLVADVNSSGPLMSSPVAARATVVVADRDIDNLELQLGQGVPVAGRAKGAAGGLVGLIAPDGRITGVAEIRPDGAFQMESIPPGSYTVAVSRLPEGSYVKSMRFGGARADDGKIDVVPAAAGELAIEVSPDAGEVHGVVRDGNGDPAAGATVQIWEAGADDARTVTSGAAGEFRFHSLPPGYYRVAAWQDLDDDLAECAPFRARFEGSAARVNVAERAHERVELKRIARETVAEEAAKLK